MTKTTSDHSIQIAIISDLHCHALTPGHEQQSFLLAGDRRTPSGRHPVQALIELAKHISLQADVLVCPGDLSHRMSQPGFMQSWDHLRELQSVFKARMFLSTLGNHDVDARRLNGDDPFFLARYAHPEFPLAAGFERDCFWANGFYFYEFASKADFLVLNTVIDHHDEKTAKRGTFDTNRIDILQQTLNRRYHDNDTARPKLRIAVMHHHPMLHSTATFTSEDVLACGDQLIDVLERFGYRIIIHGHRHDPRISRLMINGSNVFLLAVGSFSKFLKQLASRTRNLFHHLVVTTTDNDFTAEVRSWEFNYGDGWNRATTESAGFPHVIRFSTDNSPLNAAALVEALDSKDMPMLGTGALSREFPQLFLSLPSEIKALQDTLHYEHSVKLVLDPNGLVEAIGRVSQ